MSRKCSCKLLMSLVTGSQLIASWVHAQQGLVIQGGLTHEYSVQPGSRVEGEIVIRNESGETEGVRLYQTDYRFDRDGSNSYGEPGMEPRSNARWITFSPSQILVPPGENSLVKYVIAVPESDTLIGTYWSMIMVEAVPRNLLEDRLDQQTIGLNVVWRYGIQMVTNMGESGSRDLRFLETRIVKEDSLKILHVDLENTGERWLRPHLWVEIYDTRGQRLSRLDGGQIRTYPGTSVRFRLDISELKPGTYKTLVIADCGNDDLFGVNYTLKIE